MVERQVSTLDTRVRFPPPAFVPSEAVSMFSSLKTAEQAQARELRAKGWSIGEIERELGVSRASVSVWVRKVELGPEASARLLKRAGLGAFVSGQRKAAECRAKRRAYQEAGRELARAGDVTYAAGCMLYWAEGSKSRNAAHLTNADPSLCAYFVNFLRQYFNVPDAKFGVACNLFADHVARQREIEDYWLESLGLPRSSLKKSTVNRYSKYSEKKRVNKLPYGTCRVSVCSTEIVQTIYGSIQEYGGFDRPEWLD